MPVDSSGWDTTKDANGWPIGASSDVAPMVSPMERFVQGLGAISGGKFGIIRSRQDVWREKHDTQSYIDKYLQNQEQGQVAQSQMAQGVPLDRAKADRARLEQEAAQAQAALPNVGTMEAERVARAKYGTDLAASEQRLIPASEAERAAVLPLQTAKAKTELEQWPTVARIQGEKLATENPLLEDQQKKYAEAMAIERNSTLPYQQEAADLEARGLPTPGNEYAVEGPEQPGSHQTWRPRDDTQSRINQAIDGLPPEEAARVKTALAAGVRPSAALFTQRESSLVQTWNSVARDVRAKKPNATDAEITEEMFNRFPRLRFSPSSNRQPTTKPSETVLRASDEQLLSWATPKATTGPVSQAEADLASYAHQEIIDRYNRKQGQQGQQGQPVITAKPMSWWDRLSGASPTTQTNYPSATPNVDPSVAENARQAGTAAQRLVPPKAPPQQAPVDTEAERTDAQAAIEAGAPADVVKARFKERTGEEL